MARDEIDINEQWTVVVLYKNTVPTAAIVQETGEIFMLVTNTTVIRLYDLADKVDFELSWLLPSDNEVDKVGVGVLCLVDLLRKLIHNQIFPEYFTNNKIKTLEDEMMHLEFLEYTWRESFERVIKKELAH